MNNNREIWEGWTVQAFIDELQPIFDMIMAGESWKDPFKTRQEVIDWCKSEQPYYKQRIAEVENHFINQANL